AQGDAGGSPRRMAVTGAVAAAVLDGRSANWSAIRTFANAGVAATQADCAYDLRENAYQLSWLALAALFDPDAAQRANWITQLGAAYAHDARCKNNDNSWTGIIFNFNTPALTMTNGSAEVTGKGIAPGICNHAGTATDVSVTHGS